MLNWLKMKVLQAHETMLFQPSNSRSFLVVFLALLNVICTLSQPPPSFKCVTENATCQALVGYVSSNTTTLSSIQTLFGVSSFNSLLGANLLPPSTPENYTVFANQTIRVPFPCRCTNGTGLSDKVPVYTVVKGDALYFIANNRFSGANGSFLGLVTFQQIQAANNIKDGNLIMVGQKLWIPLPCSCDKVEGQKVVHYGHVIAPGSTLDQIAAEFETTSDVLIMVNGITDPNLLFAGQVLDVPLKGQVLDHLASPSEADGEIMKGLASALSPQSSWLGSDFCIWSGVVCDSNGFVTSISLPSKNISGSLPSNINSLSRLTTISLQNNHLSGALPSFANLKFLQEIHLESNNFTSIPDGAFSGLDRLRSLSLDDNPSLGSWSMPVELAGSTILVTFSATNTNLSGPIPDIFSNLTSLQILKLSSNNLTGVLPVSLGKTRIEYMWLDQQYIGLSGPLDVLASMNSLKQIWLANNKFTGPLPDLPISSSVFDFQVQNNLLTGIVPSSLISLPSLLNISLQENRLQGPYPVFPESVTVTIGDTNLFCKTVAGNCDPQVMTLLEVAGAFGYPLKLAEAWQGNDACMRWAFVTCDASKRITALNLSKQGFNGTISPALANLTSLRDLYLNDNNLTGTIPESLTTLTRLKVINVSSNDLTGKVPNFRSWVTVSTTGNKNIGLSNSNLTAGDLDNRRAKRKLLENIKILAIVLVPTVCIAVIWILVTAYKKREHMRESQEVAESRNFQRLAPNSPIRFTFKALKVATNNFDVQQKLGRGGFGSVFEGKLNDGTRVAVKRLDHLGQGRKEFLAEVCTIGSIHHVNLVKLVGFCAEKMNRVLVYEYMSNGSLDKWIFNTNSSHSLPWDAKKKIILGIAKGLAYLHEECQMRIAHLDVKPQNVLLDDNFNAKLSDFGLAKLIDRDQSFVMTQMRGTRGYLAPEWLGRKITEKADVYSYGIVVLEVVFERKSFDGSQPDESTPLIHLVKKKAEEKGLMDLLDECYDDMHHNGHYMEKIVQLAIWCLHTEPAMRPSMSMVVKVLEGAFMPETINDYSLTILETKANPVVETTQISVSVLSGPR